MYNSFFFQNNVNFDQVAAIMSSDMCTKEEQPVCLMSIVWNEKHFTNCSYMINFSTHGSAFLLASAIVPCINSDPLQNL